jgi:hypothetical protein
MEIDFVKVDCGLEFGPMQGGATEPHVDNDISDICEAEPAQGAAGYLACSSRRAYKQSK